VGALQNLSEGCASIGPHLRHRGVGRAYFISPTLIDS
jgi:hypothetical protein